MAINQQMQCGSCGRDFCGDDELKCGDPCPADDCPSRWEEVGRGHPEHPRGEQAREWSGSPSEEDPDNFWVDDETGEYVRADDGARFPSYAAAIGNEQPTA